MKLDMYGKCPECGVSWDGGGIFDTFREDPYYKKYNDGELSLLIALNYSEPYRWSRLIGVEDPLKYDGVSYWKCPDCGMMWDRFTGEKIEHEKQ